MPFLRPGPAVPRAASALALAATLLVTLTTLVRAQPTATHLGIVNPTEARFRAREVFLGKIITNEAVGRTSEVSGALVLLADGSFVAGQSIITLDLRNLKSDQDLRDKYIKANTLNVGTYPTVRFVPTSADGLPEPLPAGGFVRFQILGNLTVRDRTRPVTWDVDAELTPDLVTGTAVTTISFDQFGLIKPEIEDIASIEDEIKLELDFSASRAAAQ